MNYKTFDKLMNKNTTDNILSVLKHKPINHTELSKIVGLDRTTLYYYLKKLEKAEKILVKKQGKQIFYGLNKTQR